MSDARTLAYRLNLKLDFCQNTYGVAPCTAAGAVGTECYNTFGTCQDKINFVKGVKTYSFCSRGAPLPVGENALPYISKVETVPTEIDMTKGLSRRGVVRIKLVDEVHHDFAFDPYAATRAKPAGGTVLARLIARNRNYQGRVAELERAFFTAGWDDAEFVTERYIIEKLTGPTPEGDVDLQLKDPTKLADRVDLPTPSLGVLGAPLLLSDTLVVLAPGDGDEYEHLGHVRIGDEVLEYVDKHVDLGWNFTNASEGWTSENATTALGARALTVTATASDPILRKSGLGLSGSTYRYVAARFKRTAGTGWKGVVYYTTSGHGESGSYYKVMAAPAELVTGGDWVTVIWDMHALTAGGNDWIDNTITGLRLDLGTTTGDAYEVDWIAYNVTSPVTADNLYLPSSTYRALFGTSANTGGVGDTVQQCLVYQDMTVVDVLHDLYSRIPMTDADLDLAGWAAEQTTWLSYYRVYTVLSEPEDAADLIDDLCRNVNAKMWWHPVEQKVKLQVIGPRSPSQVTMGTLNEESGVISESVAINRRDDLRLTFQMLYYDLRSATSDRERKTSYLAGHGVIDAAAESPNEYDGRVQETMYSRWFDENSVLAVNSFVQRALTLRRDAPDEIRLAVAPKDAGYAVGDLVDLRLPYLIDEAGEMLTQRVLVTKFQERASRIELTVLTTTFGRRYGFIAPAGYPVYSGASEAQRRYAYISDAGGFMSDGTEGYLII